MKFEWDEAKDASNLRKHGVSFHEAADVFDDPFCLTEADGMENGEHRWRTFGMLRGVMLVVVVHTWRDKLGEDIIRIISARYATRKERRDYGNKNG